MKKQTGFIVIFSVTMLLMLVTVIAGVIELNIRDSVRDISSDKLAVLINVPIEEQDQDAYDRGILLQEQEALDVIKKEFMLDVNKCMYSMDYDKVVQCRDGIKGIIEDVVKVDPFYPVNN
jgi:hypothetical protein